MKKLKLILAILIVIFIAILIVIYLSFKQQDVDDVPKPIPHAENPLQESSTSHITDSEEEPTPIPTKEKEQAQSIASEDKSETELIQEEYKCLYRINSITNGVCAGSLCMVDSVSESALTMPIDSWIYTEFGKRVGIVSFDEMLTFIDGDTELHRNAIAANVKRITDIVDRYIYDPEALEIYCLRAPENGKCLLLGGATTATDCIYEYKQMSIEFADDAVITLYDSDKPISVDEFTKEFNTQKNAYSGYYSLGYVVINNNQIVEYEQCYLP